MNGFRSLGVIMMVWGLCTILLTAMPPRWGLGDGIMGGIGGATIMIGLQAYKEKR